MRYFVVFPGSFCPMTYAHILMADGVRAAVMRDFPDCAECTVIVSPVADAYGKAGLVAAAHRVAMAELAVRGMDYVVVDPWEARHTEYVHTLALLRHVREAHPDGRVLMACGVDLVLTLPTDAWPEDGVRAMLEEFPLVVVPRVVGAAMPSAQEVAEAFARRPRLAPYAARLHYCSPTDVPYTAISSTLARERIRKGLSTRGIVPSPVRAYADEHKLFAE